MTTPEVRPEGASDTACYTQRRIGWSNLRGWHDVDTGEPVEPPPPPPAKEGAARELEEIAFDVHCGLEAIDAMAFHIAELSDAEGHLDRKNHNNLTYGVALLARLLNDRFSPLANHCSKGWHQPRERDRQVSGDAG